MLAKVRPRSAYDVMAALSLFIVLGGTSFAVATGSVNSREIKNNTIRGKDIRNGTVKSKDVGNGALGLVDFKAAERAALRGPKGDAGAPGATGAPGSALAFARVNSQGGTFPAETKNVNSADVTRQEDGYYCFYDLPAGVRNAVVTLRHPVSSGNANIAAVFVGNEGDLGPCPGDEDASVAIVTPADAPINSEFYVLFN